MRIRADLDPDPKHWQKVMQDSRVTYRWAEWLLAALGGRPPPVLRPPLSPLPGRSVLHTSAHKYIFIPVIKVLSGLKKC
jgi:hypothetical protein